MSVREGRVRVAVVSASKLGSACWSALRAVGGCHQCDRVRGCALPEAVRGRLLLAERAFDRHLEESERKRVRLAAELASAKEAVGGLSDDRGQI